MIRRLFRFHPVNRLVIKLAWPVSLAMLSQTAVMVADTAMTGRLGTLPQAAAGMSGNVIWTMMSFLMGMGIGVQVLTARREGEKNYKSAGGIFLTSFSAAVLLGLVISVTGYLYGDRLINILIEDRRLSQYTSVFLKLRMLGLPFFLAAAVISGFFNGLGRTRIAMISSILTAFSNIIFNWIFIFGNLGIPAMGLEGAAWASNLAGFIGFMVYPAALFTPGMKRYFGHSVSLMSFKVLRSIAVLSLPTSMEGFLMHISFLGFYLVSLQIGTISTAATNIVITILSLSFMPGYSFGVAATTLVGNSLGAGKIQLAVQSARSAARYAVVIMSLMGLLILLFPVQLISVFTGDAQVVKEALLPLAIISLVQGADAVQTVYSSALRGAGMVYWVMRVNALLSLFIMLPVSYFLGVTFELGTTGIWSSIIFWILGLAFIFYNKFNKMEWISRKV